MEKAENPLKSRHKTLNIFIMKKKFLKLDDVRESISKIEKLEKEELKEVKGGVGLDPLPGMITYNVQPLPGAPAK